MQNKRWLTMLLALVVSIGLWFYVVTVENPVKDTTLYNIPVNFTGWEVLREDYDLIVTNSNVTGGTELTFSGKISDLNKLQQNKAEIALNIDISHLRNATEYSQPFDIGDISLPSGLSAQNISLVSNTPQRVNFTLEPLSKKTLPLVIRSTVSCRDGFSAGVPVGNFEEIVIEGPEAAISPIKNAQVFLERENVDQTITTTLPVVLCDENGDPVANDGSVTLSAAEVEVMLPVQMFKEVPLEVSLIDGGGATSKDVVYEISPKTVRLSGEAADLEGVSSISLGNIALSTIMTNDEIVSKTITIPENCTIESGETTAEVSVKISNKAIKTFNINSDRFQKKDLPADRDVEYNTSMLAITIRANEADIEQITEENIRIIVDFNGLSTATANNVSVPVTIYVDGIEGAGAVGNTAYTVNLNIISANN